MKYFFPVNQLAKISLMSSISSALLCLNSFIENILTDNSIKYFVIESSLKLGSFKIDWIRNKSIKISSMIELLLSIVSKLTPER
jgi:hypothetical protein